MLTLFLHESQRVLLTVTTKIKWQHVAQQGCKHYDCTVFTECNGYPM